MAAVKPVIELVNAPIPVESVVLLFVVVGFCEVLQHTPRAVTLVPPSAVTFPPDVAVVCVTPVILAVVTVGGAKVVKLTSFP